MKLPLVWRRTLKIFAGLFIVYFLLRVLFLVNNYRLFQEVSWQEIVEAFIYGLHFDLVAITYSNLPIFLLFFAPPEVQKYQWFARLKVVLFVFINLVFLIFNVADIEYYKFSGRRMGLDVFQLVGGMTGQALQMAMYYWYLAVLTAALIYILYKLFPRYKKEQMGVWWRRAIGGFLLLLTLILFSRGGLRRKPINPNHAFIFSEAELGVLALNTTFTMIRSRDVVELKAHNYFAEEEEIHKTIPVAVSWKQAPTKENVVLIILESFALEYVGAANAGKGYTPFLDELISRPSSRFFHNGFSNGRTSPAALPTVLSGLPNLLSSTFIRSHLSVNKVGSLAHVLRQAGYFTTFFHGAHKETLGIHFYVARLNFNETYDLSKYPNQDDHDGAWGIYDEPYFQYFLGHINKMEEPFASVVFTMSAHHPFALPDKYADKFPKGTLPIHKSVGYTDYSLRQFFERAEKQPWYKNTLFVLTADHTSMTDHEDYRGDLGPYRVPILFFHPGRQLPETDLSQPVQHMDIPLTIMHLLGVRPESWSRFGRSVFSSDPAWVVNRSLDSFWYLDQKNFLKWSEKGGLEVYSHQGTKQLQLLTNESEKQKDLESRRFYAVLQNFFNCMRENRLLVKVQQDPSQ